MTELNGKPLIRETATTVRHRPLVIEAYAGFVSLRPKGTRQRLSVDWRAVYDLAAKLAARARMEEKRKGKR